MGRVYHPPDPHHPWEDMHHPSESESLLGVVAEAFISAASVWLQLTVVPDAHLRGDTGLQ
jgi:hypothetical protein